MAGGCLFKCFDETAVFLGLASQPDQIEDSTVTAVISMEDVIAALRRLKLGEASKSNEINNTIYRGYSDQTAPILAPLYSRWLEYNVFTSSFGLAHIQVLGETADSALPLDHRPITLFSSDYKLFTKILSFRARPMLS